jgi:nicotinate phosphoribosyltransferase
MDFHTAAASDIVAGNVTDVYFLRTEQALRARGLDPRVRAEFIAKSLPEGASWAIFLGGEEVVSLAEEAELPVTIRVLPEGTIFRAGQPLLEIEGPYLAFGRFETAFLGLIAHASGVATRAGRARLAAQGRPVVCFGARRVHPVLAPAVERFAWLGGADGVAAVLSAERLGIAPTGTMPHALVLLFGDTVEAARALDQVLPREIPRVVLVDTLEDERFEAIRVAEAFGPALAGVRLDTPASRRGDFLALLEEVRWELDQRGFRHVKIFVSGGIGVRDILRLNPAADAYGVGTYLTAAPPLDISMDLVEVQGKPLSKRGKWSGAKSLWRCEACGGDRVLPLGADPGRCPCGGSYEDLLRPALREGRRLSPPEPADAVRSRVVSAVSSGRYGFPPAELDSDRARESGRSR